MCNGQQAPVIARVTGHGIRMGQQDLVRWCTGHWFCSGTVKASAGTVLVQFWFLVQFWLRLVLFWISSGLPSNSSFARTKLSSRTKYLFFLSTFFFIDWLIENILVFQFLLAVVYSRFVDLVFCNERATYFEVSKSILNRSVILYMFFSRPVFFCRSIEKCFKFSLGCVIPFCFWSDE